MMIFVLSCLSISVSYAASALCPCPIQGHYSACTASGTDDGHHLCCFHSSCPPVFQSSSNLDHNSGPAQTPPIGSRAYFSRCLLNVTLKGSHILYGEPLYYCASDHGWIIYRSIISGCGSAKHPIYTLLIYLHFPEQNSDIPCVGTAH